MKITEKDILRTAQQLRDEENEQLHVPRWRRSRHFHIPAWLVAVPAAAIAGFVLGLWTNNTVKTDAPLTALVDTVYIKVKETSVTPDTASHVIPQESATEKKAGKRLRSSNVVKRSQPSSQGKSIAYDQIRYDLLVKN